MQEKEPVQSAILTDLYARLSNAKETLSGRKRPYVTLAYAQSLDGSIAGDTGRPLGLSGPSSLQLTHELRAAHDAILVGIGTVLADDPQLNVRLVAGHDPQPIVVDSRLRLPETCHLLSNGRGAWVATTDDASDEAVSRISAKGADVLRLPALDNGWVDLESVMAVLAERGTFHLLVEGGARILTSFLKARLADYVVLTMAPRFVGGVPALVQHELSPFPELTSWQSERLGDDLVLAGELSWSDR